MSLEESLVEYCAPTLAGLKAASLYCFSPIFERPEGASIWPFMKNF